MSESQPLCERCGRPALVHITNEIGLEGHVRHYCLSCAARQDGGRRPAERRLNRGAVFMLVGVFTMTFSLFADQIGFGVYSGFGWRQNLALILGFVLVCVGTLMRAATLFSIGAAMTLLAILADWLRMGNVQGFGLKQAVGTVLGFTLVIAGILRVRQAYEPPK